MIIEENIIKEFVIIHKSDDYLMIDAGKYGYFFIYNDIVPSHDIGDTIVLHICHKVDRSVFGYEKEYTVFDIV